MADAGGLEGWRCCWNREVPSRTRGRFDMFSREVEVDRGCWRGMERFLEVE